MLGPLPGRGGHNLYVAGLVLEDCLSSNANAWLEF